MLWQLAKRGLFGVACVLALPLILAAAVEAAVTSGRSERVFAGCKELLALVPTVLGQYLRAAFYWASCRHVAWDVCLLLGAMIAHRETTIGRRVVIGSYSIVGLAHIEDDVLVASRVSIVSGKFQHGRPRDRMLASGVERYETMHVGRNAWIGEGALILAPVGAHCTIAAGAVLTREAPEGATFVGNPARRVDRASDALDLTEGRRRSATRPPTATPSP